MGRRIQSVGIIGLGNFGQFVAGLLPESVHVFGYDIAPPQLPEQATHIHISTLAEVAGADVLVLAIPLQTYGVVLPKVGRHIRPETLVVDVCSVKVRPAQLLRKHLQDHPNMLITHPLFGPQSAARDKTKGRELIVTESRGSKADTVLDYCKDALGLTIRHTTADEHDRAMAQVHALTFFVAHGLAQAKVGEDVPFATPSFQSLLNLVALDKSHTKALFDTIQRGNPYAREAREALLRSLEGINNAL